MKWKRYITTPKMRRQKCGNMHHWVLKSCKKWADENVAICTTAYWKGVSFGEERDKGLFWHPKPNAISILDAKNERTFYSIVSQFLAKSSTWIPFTEIKGGVQKSKLFTKKIAFWIFVWQMIYKCFKHPLKILKENNEIHV